MKYVYLFDNYVSIVVEIKRWLVENLGILIFNKFIFNIDFL